MLFRIGGVVVVVIVGVIEGAVLIVVVVVVVVVVKVVVVVVVAVVVVVVVLEGVVMGNSVEVGVGRIVVEIVSVIEVDREVFAFKFLFVLCYVHRLPCF